jgi:hypothetical protein
MDAVDPGIGRVVEKTRPAALVGLAGGIVTQLVADRAMFAIVLCVVQG